MLIAPEDFPLEIEPHPFHKDSDPAETGFFSLPEMDQGSPSTQAGPGKEIVGEELLNVKGGLATDSKVEPMKLGIPSPEPEFDSTGTHLPNRPVVDQGAPSTPAGREKNVAGEDLLNVKGGLVTDSKEGLLKAEVLSAEPGSKSTETGFLNRPAVDQVSPSTPAGTGREIVQHDLQDPRESLVVNPAGQRIEPSQASTPFVREGRAGGQTINKEFTDSARKGETSIREEPIPFSAHPESGQALESLPSPRPLSQSPFSVTSPETGRGSLPHLCRTDPAQIYEQLGKQLLWSLKNGQEKIRMVLEPPELGNIYMEVKREKDLVNATLWTDNAATKELLERHQIQLHKLLKADGFALEKFDVFVQQGMGWLGSREKPLDPGPRFQAETQDEGRARGPASQEIGGLEPGLSIRNSRYVDLFV
jgi:hypothetical protein